MTVRDLIAELKNYDGDTPVHLAYPYGDYWKTTAAPEVESVETGVVEDWAYAGSVRLVPEEDLEDEDVPAKANRHEAVVLSF